MKEIIIDGVKMNLDVERAKRVGLLVEKFDINRETLLPGDVFKGGRINSVLLVQAIFGNPRSYQLLGIGASPNSNSFYEGLHTLGEIRAYLEQHRMKFVENVQSDIVRLVASR